MNISELVDVDFLRSNIDGGYISERYHEKYDLAILNYTPKAAYARNWNDATRICRGMVVDGGGEIIARPFPKFFNIGEPDGDQIAGDEKVVVTDKADGSLLIIFKHMDDIVVATRGSFYSEQAILASKFINAERYDPDILDNNTTYLAELCGPSNRIVLQYNSDKIIRIANVNNTTGEYSLAPYGEPFLDIDPVGVFGYMTLDEALSIPPRPNAEGFVLYTTDGRALKSKQEDYVSMHRLVFGLNKRRVWEQILEGKSLEEIKEPLPDEFYDLVTGWYKEIHAEWAQAVTEIWDYFWELDDVAYGPRKDFAVRVQSDVPAEYRGYMFKLLDANDGIAYDVLKTLKPKSDE